MRGSSGPSYRKSVTVLLLNLFKDDEAPPCIAARIKLELGKGVGEVTKQQKANGPTQHNTSAFL